MKIYTKTGDKGSTSLIGGSRVQKSHIRIESYGTVDELNSWLGLIRDQKIDVVHKKTLTQVQNDLFIIGAQLALDPNKKSSGKKSIMSVPELSGETILFLESEIDKMEQDLPQMTHFILPGGHTTVSYCHIARTICRRAERTIVLLNETESINETILSFLNRLSDYLFVLARKLSQDLKIKEVKWIP